jgi:hypothetical protein
VSIPEYHTNRTKNHVSRAPHATMSIAMLPGPVIDSLCTGYGGFDIGGWPRWVVGARLRH